MNNFVHDMAKGSAMQNEQFAELLSILEETGKHTSYQALPPQLSSEKQLLSQYPAVSRQDERRYVWLQSKLNSIAGPVIDIGANLGYFSFRINDHYRSKVIAYEPYEPHSRAIGLLRDLCKIEPAQIAVENQGVGLREIDSLPQAELIVLLNVVQHAGEDFDTDLVRTVNDWRDYAIDFLSALRAKTKYLFFQTGYTWLGHAAKLCDDEEIIDFTVSILTSAGWTIRHCGVIEQFQTDMQYQDFSISLDGHNTVFLSGPSNRLLSRIRRKFLGDSTQTPSYRFAQRPLWLCSSKP